MKSISGFAQIFLIFILSSKPPSIIIHFETKFGWLFGILPLKEHPTFSKLSFHQLRGCSKWCIATYGNLTLRHKNTDLISNPITLTSRREDTSFHSIDYSSGGGCTIKIPFEINVQQHHPGLNQTCSYWFC